MATTRYRPVIKFDHHVPRCDRTDRYTGRRRPTCDEGRGCQACWAKHRAFVIANPPKVTGEFRVFYDYICNQKRLLQMIRVPADMKMGLHEFYDRMERLIRTGSYRFFGSVLDENLDFIQPKPKAKARK